MREETGAPHDGDGTSLRGLQRAIASVIFTPLTSNNRMQRTTTSGARTRDIASRFMRPNGILTGAERLEIYNRQYWFRLIDCVYDDFPGLNAILGEKKFYNLVVKYLTFYPSRSFALRDLGSHMVQFLIDYPQLVGSRLNAAIDMARFEWAQIVAFDGPQKPALRIEELMSMEGHQMQFALQPYLTLLDLSYPFDDFILALRKEENQRSEASSERIHEASRERRAALPKKRRTYLAVHRHQNILYYKRLDEPSFALLSALQQGASLGDACTAGVSLLPARVIKNGETTNLLQEWFQTWGQLQWFCRKDDGSVQEPNLFMNG